MKLSGRTMHTLVCAVSVILLALLLLLLRGCGAKEPCLKPPIIAVPRTAVTNIDPGKDSPQEILAQVIITSKE